MKMNVNKLPPIKAAKYFEVNTGDILEDSEGDFLIVIDEESTREEVQGVYLDRGVLTILKQLQRAVSDSDYKLVKCTLTKEGYV